MTVHYNRARQRWCYDFRVAGARHQGYCLHEDGRPAKNRTEAKRLRDDLRARLRRDSREARPAPGVYSFAQAIAAYLLSRNPGRNFETNQKKYAAELLQYFGPATALVDIREPEIASYVAWARQQPVLIWIAGNRKGRDRADPRWWKPSGQLRSDATVNRYLDALRATLLLAHATQDPFTGRRLLEFPPTVPELDEHQRLARPVPDAAIGPILEHAAPHIAEAAVLGHHFPLRKQEVLGLAIRHVDPYIRGIRLPGEETKSGRDEVMLASDAAWAFLEFLVAQAKKRGIDWLVAWKPPGRNKSWQRLHDIKRGWKAAQRRAGIVAPYRFHDTKAAFSSTLAGVADRERVRDMSRHKDAGTTDRYIAAIDDGRRAALELVAERTSTTAFMRRLAKKEK